MQAGARGTQACDAAVRELSGIIGDLETTALFADSGTLAPDEVDDNIVQLVAELLQRVFQDVVVKRQAIGADGGRGIQCDLKIVAM